MGSMGGGYSEGSQSSRSAPWKPFQKPLIGLGLGMMDPSQRESQLSRIMMNPERYKSIGDTYYSQTRPEYLDVANDPNIQRLMSASSTVGKNLMNSGLADIRSRGAMQGHYTPNSGRMQQAQSLATERFGQNLGQYQAESMMDLLRGRQAIQQASLGNLQDFESLPLQLLMDISGRGSTSSGKSSGMNVGGQAGKS